MPPKTPKKPGTTPAGALRAGAETNADRLARLLTLLEGAKRQRTGAKSGVERAAIGRQLDLKEISMEGITFNIKARVENGKLSISKSNIDSFKGQFGVEFDKASGVTELAKKYKVILGNKVTLDDAKDLLENQYVVLYLKKARESFKAEYPYLEEYAKKAKVKNFDLVMKIKQVGDSHEALYESNPKDRLDGYDEWVKKNKKPKEDPKKSKNKPKAKVKAKPEEDAERQEALTRFKKTSLGKMFGMMKDENGRTMLDKIAKGDAPMVIFALLGILGFKTLGGGIWEGVRDATKGTKLEANLKSIEKKARGSRFAASKEEDRRLAKFAKHNSRQFGEFLARAGDGADVPKKGLTLTQSYNFRGAAMNVKFGAGGKMVVPGPANIFVNGNRTTVAKGKTRPYSYSENDREVEIGGTLPKGTRFEGKVTLASVAAGKAKTSKTSPTRKSAAKPVAGKSKATPSRTPAAGKGKKKATPRRSASK